MSPNVATRVPSDMPFRQSTVSIWTHLKDKFLDYCTLSGKTSSVFVNELLEETFARIEADRPDLPSFFVSSLRRKLGKDVEVKLSETLHRQFFDIDPIAERSKEEAAYNTGLLVPQLLRARRRGWSWDKARRRACGSVQTDLTRQLGQLYDDPMTLEAAIAKMGGTNPTTPLIRVYNEAYRILLRHTLTLAIGTKLPPRFQSLLNEPA